MMLKRNKSQTSQSVSRTWSLLRAGLAGLGVMLCGAAVTAGCLDRPVAPATPRTNNVYVSEIRQTAVDKIDLLFMIDNSISMADKQAILADAVPLLVQRLITPICVDDAGNPTGGNAPCGGGNAPEFSPIKDIHVGVITSSLGSHGAAGPKDVCVTPEDDDHAHLLGQIRTGLQPYDGNGFLKWDQTGTGDDPPLYNPPGDSDGAVFTDKFTSMVVASGEQGCGYEASLEAWYKFLIDPEPPAAVVVPPMTSTSVPMGIDEVILSQRKAFLRPDSLVAIVMLSDENDCSIVDEGYGWLIARSAPMYRSTSQCLSNPNDKCCQSCGEVAANAGCGDIKADPECTKGDVYQAAEGADDLNLRCWQQKRRFGFELLYPTARYSDALRNPQVIRRSTGMAEVSPLYLPAPGKAPREPGLVFLAGIIGVPWQDIATQDSVGGAGLKYKTAQQINADGVWDIILGDPKASPPKLPTDPLMVETPEDRTTIAGLSQTNPITMDALVPSTSTNPTANKINGHEQKNLGTRDLQYACTFPLGTPITCDTARFDADKGCDCFIDDLPYNRPLCQPPGGGEPTIQQNFAKAYPGLRHLQVLKEFGQNSIVASICPKVIDKGDQLNYGYNPAVGAIIDRLKEALKGKCLPRPLEPDAAGQVPCKVVEAVRPTGGGCNCAGSNGRAELDSADLRNSILRTLETNQTCSATDPANKCSDYCTCEILQFAGDDLGVCQNQRVPPKPGYCYINRAPGEENVGNEELVKDCPADQKRLLNFGVNTPSNGAIALVACLGKPLGSD